MVYSKVFTKLLFTGIICLVIILLLMKMLAWPQRVLILTPSELETTMRIVNTMNDSAKTQNIIDGYETYPSTGLERRFPTALIIGFSKCGTHALRTYLTLHPRIVAQDLELGFFNKHFEKGFAWYKDQQPESLPNQITVEKTPSYVLSKVAIQRMHDLNPKFKLILLVRDPVVRVQSLYARADSQIEGFNQSFTRWLKAKGKSRTLLECGNYAPYIRDIYNIFNEDQVLILDGELFSRNPAKVMQECAKFLGIEPVFQNNLFVFNKEKGFFCINVKSPIFRSLLDSKEFYKVDKKTGCFTESKGREHPQIPKDMEEQLITLFRATTEDLFHVIGKRFDWTGFYGGGGDDDNDYM